MTCSVQRTQKSHRPSFFLTNSFLLYPTQWGDSKELHLGVKTDRNLSSFYTQSVLVLIVLALSSINMHICMCTDLWKDPLIWRLRKYFLNSWNIPFHWVMFKLQTGLCLPRYLPVAWLPVVFSLGPLAVSWALLPVLFCSAYFEPQGHWWLTFGLRLLKSQDAPLLAGGTLDGRKGGSSRKWGRKSTQAPSDLTQ